MSVILPVKPGFLFAEWISCQADDLFPSDASQAVSSLTFFFPSFPLSFSPPSFPPICLYFPIRTSNSRAVYCFFKLPPPVLLATIFPIICVRLEFDLFVSLLFLPCPFIPFFFLQPGEIVGLCPL